MECTHGEAGVGAGRRLGCRAEPRDHLLGQAVMRLIETGGDYRRCRDGIVPLGLSR